MSVNSITGVVVCQNNAQRNQIVNAMSKYARNHDIPAGPLINLIDTNKYGNGPAFILFALFEDDRAEADQAWAALDPAARATLIQNGSFLIQMSGETTVHSEIWNPDRTVLV